MVGKLQKNGMLMLKFNISAQGYVLLAVLVFLQIFSLLGLFALTQANLVLKTNASHWLATGYRQTTISVLAEVEARVMRDPSACVMPLTAAADVAVKSESWWQQNACMISAQGAIYRYVVESLGQDLCGVFESNDNRLMHAENYRITLFALPQNNTPTKYSGKSGQYRTPLYRGHTFNRSRSANVARHLKGNQV
jgi:hypothetical protein